MQYLVLNLDTRSIKREKFQGRDYLVANVVMIVPGILNGSQGPLLYTKEENDKSVHEWNFIPITKDHPNDSDGNPTTARSPEIINSIGIGFLFNTESNDKLIAEAWFDEERTKIVSPIIYKKLVNGEPLEVSTGLHTNNIPAPKNATWNGQPYTAKATDYKPDHLAVFEYETGACSNQDGCGININRLVTNFGEDTPEETKSKKKIRRLFISIKQVFPETVFDSYYNDIEIRRHGKIITLTFGPNLPEPLEAEISFSDPSLSSAIDHKKLKKGTITFLRELKQVMSIIKSHGIAISYSPTTPKRDKLYKKALSIVGFEDVTDDEMAEDGYRLWNEYYEDDEGNQEDIAEKIEEIVQRVFPDSNLSLRYLYGHYTGFIHTGNKTLTLDIELDFDGKVTVDIGFTDPKISQLTNPKDLSRGSVDFARKLKQFIAELKRNNIKVRYVPTTEKRGDKYKRALEKAGYKLENPEEAESRGEYIWHEKSRETPPKDSKSNSRVYGNIAQFTNVVEDVVRKQFPVCRIHVTSNDTLVKCDDNYKKLILRLELDTNGRGHVLIAFRDDKISMRSHPKEVSRGSVSFIRKLIALLKDLKNLGIVIRYDPTTKKREDKYKKYMEKAGYKEQEQEFGLWYWNEESEQQKTNQPTLDDPKDWIFTSSNVKEIRYDSSTREAIVTYKHGNKTWAYRIPIDKARRFFQSGSKGIWLWDNVKVRGKGNQGKHRVPARSLNKLNTNMKFYDIVQRISKKVHELFTTSPKIRLIEQALGNLAILETSYLGRTKLVLQIDDGDELVKIDFEELNPDKSLKSKKYSTDPKEFAAKELRKGSIAFARKLKELTNFIKSLGYGIIASPSTKSRGRIYSKVLGSEGFSKVGSDTWNASDLYGRYRDSIEDNIDRIRQIESLNNIDRLEKDRRTKTHIIAISRIFQRLFSGWDSGDTDKITDHLYANYPVSMQITTLTTLLIRMINQGIIIPTEESGWYEPQTHDTRLKNLIAIVESVYGDDYSVDSSGSTWHNISVDTFGRLVHIAYDNNTRVVHLSFKFDDPDDQGYGEVKKELKRDTIKFLKELKLLVSKLKAGGYKLSFSPAGYGKHYKKRKKIYEKAMDDVGYEFDQGVWNRGEAFGRSSASIEYSLGRLVDIYLDEDLTPEDKKDLYALQILKINAMLSTLFDGWRQSYGRSTLEQYLFADPPLSMASSYLENILEDFVRVGELTPTRFSGWYNKEEEEAKYRPRIEKLHELIRHSFGSRVEEIPVSGAYNDAFYRVNAHGRVITVGYVGTTDRVDINFQLKDKLGYSHIEKEPRKDTGAFKRAMLDFVGKLKQNNFKLRFSAAGDAKKKAQRERVYKKGMSSVGYEYDESTGLWNEYNTNVGIPRGLPKGDTALPHKGFEGPQQPVKILFDLPRATNSPERMVRIFAEVKGYSLKKPVTDKLYKEYLTYLRNPKKINEEYKKRNPNAKPVEKKLSEIKVGDTVEYQGSYYRVSKIRKIANRIGLDFVDGSGTNTLDPDTKFTVLKTSTNNMQRRLLLTNAGEIAKLDQAWVSIRRVYNTFGTFRRKYKIKQGGQVLSKLSSAAHEIEKLAGRTDRTKKLTGRDLGVLKKHMGVVLTILNRQDLINQLLDFDNNIEVLKGHKVLSHIEQAKKDVADALGLLERMETKFRNQRQIRADEEEAISKLLKLRNDPTGNQLNEGWNLVGNYSVYVANKGEIQKLLKTYSAAKQLFTQLNRDNYNKPGTKTALTNFKIFTEELAKLQKNNNRIAKTNALKVHDALKDLIGFIKNISQKSDTRYPRIARIANRTLTIMQDGYNSFKKVLESYLTKDSKSSADALEPNQQVRSTYLKLVADLNKDIDLMLRAPERIKIDSFREVQKTVDKLSRINSKVVKEELKKLKPKVDKLRSKLLAVKTVAGVKGLSSGIKTVAEAVFSKFRSIFNEEGQTTSPSENLVSTNILENNDSDKWQEAKTLANNQGYENHSNYWQLVTEIYNSIK